MWRVLIPVLGILKDLKKCFETSSRDKDAAIKAAHRDRDLKQAVQDGNIEAVKQITDVPQSTPLEISQSAHEWATLKFGKMETEQLEGKF